ncbi:hypothetical protein [Planococcus wigleyi]|uniref:Uncharacterized protein n=1 Tax=Planococcus wigleyi TaxID=2762216 RepID=A0ABR8WEM5_9BACL|nr:hypothetical protein [Planococcus wigleyi]MBD8015468.1 hypothetical protein [Planococcus wigleyi]
MEPVGLKREEESISNNWLWLPVLIFLMNCIRYVEIMAYRSLALYQVILFSLNIMGILYLSWVIYKGKIERNKPTGRRHYKI